jgi:hypothetical protein
MLNRIPEVGSKKYSIIKAQCSIFNLNAVYGNSTLFYFIEHCTFTSSISPFPEIIGINKG